MKIAEWSVKNSLLVNLISVFIIIAGVYSMMQMRREAFPPVDYDIVTITTAWPGAPTEDVEKFVTIPIEKEIKSVSGIDEIDSKSDEGLSSIGITLDPSVKDKKKVVKDIERAVDRVSNLPRDIEEDPIVFELATREFPVIEVSIGGAVSGKVRRQHAENLEELLEDVEGVASVRRIGWRDQEYWVEVDSKKMNDYHVSIQEVMDALATRNVTVPGGQLTTLNNEFNVRTTGEFRTPEEIGEVIIRANDSGNWLKVRDIAVVRDEFEDATTIAKVRGEDASAMVVVKTEEGDAIKVVDGVKDVIEQFEKTLPDEMSVDTANDFSYYVKRRLGVLKNNGIIGFILVLLILFIFLDPIPAFMTAIGIPIAFCISFLVMNMFGITINLVSMLGIILVLGMLVDDGIIVSENVYRYVEEGMEPRAAAIKGTNEVAMPVTITILTTFAAFGPLLFMDDILGKFIREIPKVVLITLTASLIEAFIILPSHLCDVLVMFKHKAGVNKEKRWYVALKKSYQNFLQKCLKGRYLVFLVMILVFLFSVWVAKNKLKFMLFAGEGIEYFWVRAEAPKGTPLIKMEEMMKPIEDMVDKLPSDELDSYRTYIGSIESERGFDPNAKRGTHLGYVTVFLTPAQKRNRTPQEIVEEIKVQLKDLEGFDKLYTLIPKEGPPVGADVEIGLKGDDYSVMEEMAVPFIKALEERKGVSGISTSYDFGKKQLRITVDEEKAKKYGLTINQVARSVRNVFKGGIATTIKPDKAEEEINVLVRYPEEQRNNRDVFDEILIPNAKGNLIKLKSVASIEETEGVYQINHLDGKRILYITAQVDNKDATSREVNLEIQEEFKGFAKDYLGYSVVYGGEFEDQQKTFKNLLWSYFFALCMIFILLVGMFRSMLQPFIIMTAIPFGIIGVFLSFWVHDMIPGVDRPLNFFALMGLVGLTGIVVNDSVVLVDFINRMRKRGHTRRQSIIEGGVVRLRPVIMTSVTTIGGLFSVAYGIGGGDPFLKPMALAIVWGLTFSTVLTLIGIPCLYAIMDDFAVRVFKHSIVRTDKVEI